MSAPSPQRPERIRLLLTAGRLQEEAFTSSEVMALWAKAVASAGDALLPGMSLDGALRAAYDATLDGCFALLALHGLRVRSGAGHHEVTFAAVEALGLSALADIVPESEEIRSIRRGSVYDPEMAEEGDRGKAIDWMIKVLPRVRAALIAGAPALAGTLPEPPSSR